MNTKLILCTTLIYACNASAMLTEAVRQSARMSRQAAASVLAPDRNNLHIDMNRFGLLPSQKFSTPMNIKRHFSSSSNPDARHLHFATMSVKLWRDSFVLGARGTAASFALLAISNYAHSSFRLSGPFELIAVTANGAGFIGSVVCPLLTIYAACAWARDGARLTHFEEKLAKQQHANEAQENSRVELSDE